LLEAPVIASFSYEDRVFGDDIASANSLALTGTAVTQSVVSLFDGNVLLGSTETDANGFWSFATGILADGAHNFTATAIDSNGNTSTVSTVLTVSVDAQAGTAPEITSLSLNERDPNTGIADVATLTGVAVAQSVVEVLNGNVPLGSSEANAAGVWTFTANTLPNGANSFTAADTDSSDITGSISTPVVVAVDGTAQVSSAANATSPITVAAGATIEINGISDQTVTFTNTTGALKLDSPQTFTGQISGLAGSDAIDLAGVNYGANTTATFSGTTTGGTLTVSDGTHTANIALQGDYLASNWDLSNDGNGGTTVVDPVPPNNWQTLDIGAGGFLSGMDIAPDGTMVVRTDTYGAYIWNGTEWQQLVTSTSMPAAFVTPSSVANAQGVYEIQIAPSNSDIMYMMYQGYVFESSNKGTTWTETSFAPVAETPNDNYRWYGQKMAVDPENPNVVYVGTPQNGLFDSTNGGATWQSVSAVPVSQNDGSGNYPGIDGIQFDPALGVTGGKTNTIFASSYGNGVYESTNAGASWSAIGGPSNVIYAAVSSTGVYYAVGDSGSSSLWSYTNGTWTELLSNYYNGIQAVAIDPFNPEHVVISTPGGNLDESLNGGATWTGLDWSNQLSSSDIPWLAGSGSYMTIGGLAFDPLVPDELFASSGVGVWNTNLPTVNSSLGYWSAPIVWNDQSVGIEQLVANEVLVAPGGDPVVASWDRGFFYINNANAYPSTYGPVNGSFVAGWSLDYASSNPGFLVGIADWWGNEESGYSTNGGLTWSPFQTELTDVIGGTIAASSPTNIIWAPANGTQPYYTLDGGETWNPINLPGVTSWSGFDWAYYLDTRTVTADRVLPNTFYLYDYEYGLFETTNGGVTWTEQHVGQITDWSGDNALLASVPGKAGNLFFTPGDANPSLLESTDQGATWTVIPNVEVTTFGFGAPAPGQSYPSIYIVGHVNGVYGIWQSINEGQSWTQIGTYPDSSLDTIHTISGDPNVFGQVYVGFSGSGFAYLPAASAAGAAPTIGSFSPDSGIVGDGITKASVLTLTGFAEANSTVKVYDGVTLLGSATANGSGAWSFTTAALSNGSHSLTATATDGSGNVSPASSAMAVTIDTVAPVAPTIASFSPDSGVVGDHITNGNTLTLTGSAEANSTIKVYDGATLLGTATANGSGAWSFTTAALSNGSHSLTATATDAAGNTGAASSAMAVTIDTVTPSAPVIVSDPIVNTNEVALGGTAEANSTVKVYDGATLLGSAIANGSGAWSFTTAALSNGAHSFTATASDAAGNTGVASGAMAVTVGTATPNITSFSPDSDVVGDGITDASVLTLTGSAAANSTVKVYDGATLLGSVTANGSGAWTYTTAALSNGSHSLTATATDTSGNVSTASSAVAVTVDTVAPVAPTIASFSTDSGVVGDHITNDSTLTLTGSAEANCTVKIYDGATLLGSAAANGSGAWTYTTAALSNGSHSLTATATDVAGNISTASSAMAVTVDTVAPVAPTIASFSTDSGTVGDGITDASVLTLTGSAEANSTVKVYDGATLLGSAAANGSGAWTYTTAALSNDVHNLTATATDVAGNIGTASSALAVTVDTVAPVAPTIASFSTDSGVVGDHITNDSTLTLTGSAEANSTVKIYDGAALLGSATANGSGAWTYTTAALSNGAHNLTATATDAAGNTGVASSATAVTIDTVAPVAPSIASFSTDSGVLGDGITNDNTLTVTGAAEANSTIKVYDGATLLGSATANGSGAWSYTTAPLSNGAHSLTATATDAAGNISSASSTMPATIDTVAPIAPSITSFSPESGVVGDHIANVNTVTLTGAAEANSTVKVYDGGTLLGSATANGSGAWSYTTAALSNGAHSLTATATDAAGNTGAASSATAVTIDTVAPNAPVIVSDTTFNTNQLALIGSAEANSTVKIYDGATLLGSATANGSGAWSFTTAALSNGSHSLTATASDAAGNTGVASSAMAVTIDTVAPVAPSIASFSTDSGVVGDGITNDNTLTLTGAAEANSTIKVYDGATLLGSAKANGSGAWSYTSAALSNGAHSLTATATDAAGNVSTASSAMAVTIDTVAPVAPSITSFSPDSGVVGDHLTNVNTVALTGAAEANSTVKVYDGATLLGTATANGSGGWSYTTAALSNGAHSLTATATDAAGNTGTASSPTAVTIDTVSPNAPVIISDTTFNTNQLALIGSAEANSTVKIYDGATLLGSATANGIGAWTYTTAALNEGAHNFTATATDAAGNTSLASQPVNPTIALAAPTIVSYSTDTGILGDGVTNDKTPTLIGSAQANSTVKIYDGATLLGSTTANGSGAWSFTTAALADGAHSLNATATDVSGNTSTDSLALNITVDTVAPVPVITNTLLSLKGYVLLTGTSEANSTISIYNSANGALIGTTVTLANGTWTFLKTGSGATSFTVTATDLAGNTTQTSNLQAPAAPGITSVSPDSGVLGDHITNVNTLTLTGSAQANSTVKVYDGATLLGSATANGSGAWSYTTTALSNGAHSLTATATDGSGNVSSASSATAVTIDNVAPVAPSITSFSPDSGVVGDHITNGSTVTLTGAAEANSTIKVYDGATLLGSATANGSGAWSYTTASLSNGSHSLTATATDTAGNVSAASSVTAVTIDTVAPVAPSIVSFSPDTGTVGDGVTGASVLTLIGAAEANSTVKVYDGATLLGTATANSSGAWSYTTAVLSNGAHNLTATATDAAGNVSTASSTMAVTVDTVAPVSPTIVSFSTDSGVVGDGITNDNTLTLTGAAEANSVVKVYDGATLLGSATANGSGAWSYTTAALNNGAHSLTATATDAAGNTGVASSAMAVTIDTVAPVSPTIASFSTDSGVVGDGTTNDNTLTLTGAAEANSTVKVYDGATLLGSATANGSGAWTYTTAVLSNGAHSLTATATDAAGNISTASSAMAVTIDTVAPSAPSITSDNFTSPNVVTLTGSAEANSQITVYDGISTLGTAIANSLGVWAFTSGVLADGAHALAATATDAAGNTSVLSSVVDPVVDTVAPLAPSVVSFSPDSGTVGDGLTNSGVITLTGAAEANSTVKVYDGATLLGSATANGSGAWSYTTAALSNGAHSLTATATDASGNVSTASSAMPVTIDTVAPVAPSITSFSPDSGVVGDHITNGSTVTLTGAAEANSTIKVYDGATLLGSATANGSGTWTFTTAALSNGAHSLSATATDAAGNISTASSAMPVTIDTVAPVAPSIASFSTDSGAVGDHITNDNTLTLSGSAEANSTIKVYDGANLLGSATANGSGAWSFTTAALADGGHGLTSTATDAAGNVSAPSSALAVTIDTAAPVTPTIASFSPDTGTVGDGITNANVLTLTGSAESSSTVKVYDGATLLGSATANGSGAWTYTTVSLSNGAHSLTITATDAAGNVSTVSSAIAVTVDAVVPAAPSVISFSPDTGTVGDGITDANVLTLLGLADANSLVNVFDGAALLGSVAANGSGAWSFTTAALADGSHSLTAAETLAGITGPGSSALAVVVDTTAPLAPSIASFSNDSGVVGDHVTNDNTLMLTGSAEANSTVKIYDGGTSLGSTAANGAGAWTYDTAALADGSHSLTATATDAAGNVGTGSASLALTIDTVAPTAPSIASFSPDTGTFGDGITNANVLTLTGFAEANSTVKVYDGSTLLGSSATNVSGVWSFATGTLANGSHDFMATATDAAGNVSADTSALAVTVDNSLAPIAVTNTSLSLSVKGAGVLSGNSAADSTISIVDSTSGASLGHTTVAANGAWSLSMGLSNSIHSLTETATNQSGNTGSMNVVFGTTGSDTFTSTPANETFFGRGGNETFVFAGNFGNDTIADFQSSSNVLQLAQSDFTNFAAVLAHAAQVGSDVVITADPHGTITLQNTMVSQLNINNVHLA